MTVGRVSPQAGGAAAAAAAGGDAPDGLDAAMQQTAVPVPLQPHVSRDVFSEACAAYEPPHKPGRPADQSGTDKKEAQVRSSHGCGEAACRGGERKIAMVVASATAAQPTSRQCRLRSS